ncbi:hypothetical protein N136_03848 [Leifsonia aquatica ATCC 14665]|uniref:Uncharacterized protein n=1 Tax=Leifsonia aquatica ATCC 14665 TaxID=1358026 RepID=U2SX17_LEIAQ|nr:hypothetical protein N136_03848 [Leifsonia aquatica ATCC 14665]
MVEPAGLLICPDDAASVREGVPGFGRDLVDRLRGTGVAHRTAARGVSPTGRTEPRAVEEEGPANDHHRRTRDEETSHEHDLANHAGNLPRTHRAPPAASLESPGAGRIPLTADVIRGRPPATPPYISAHRIHTGRADGTSPSATSSKTCCMRLTREHGCPEREPDSSLVLIHRRRSLFGGHRGDVGMVRDGARRGLQRRVQGTHGRDE